MASRARELLAPLLQAGARKSETAQPNAGVLTWANLVTAIRLAGLPFFVLLVDRSAWLSAFVLAWLLASFDVLDGYLARRLRQVSRIGSILDPVVDRVTIATVGLTLAFAGAAPWWLVIAALVRDLVLVSYGLTRFERWRRVTVTVTGKFGSLTMIFGIPLYLLARTTGSGRMAVTATVLVSVGLLLYYVSLIQYVLRMSGAEDGHGSH